MNSVLVYSKGKVEHGKIASIKNSQTVWADFVSPSDEELEELSKFTGIAAAQIRDWLTGKKRPMALDFQHYSVMIFLIPHHEQEKKGEILTTETCVTLVSNNRNDFITIHNKPFKSLRDMREYTTKHQTDIFRERATFLLLTMLNEMMEDFYESLDLINETVHQAEELALDVHPEKNLMRRILLAKKSMMLFHKALISNREVITAIEQEHLSFLDDKLLREFRIISSTITQLVEINSTYRDILNIATEIHLTAISNSLNVTMKKLTSWAAIILFPSLIASIFGMNFEHTPVFEWKWGFWGSIALMAASIVGLYVFFRKKDWI